MNSVNAKDLYVTPSWNTGPDAGVLSRYEAVAAMTLRRTGFRIHTRNDMENFAPFLETAPGNDGVNPTFDARVNDISATAFWMQLTTGQGETVAIMASRCFVTDRYFDLMRDGTMWFPEPTSKPIQLANDLPGPSGRISQSGGLWVHPSYRGEGLSWIVPRIVSARSARRWSVDYHTGVVFGALHRKEIPAKNYGVSRSTLCFDGYFPPAKKTAAVFCVETSRDAIIDRSRSDTEILLSQSHSQVRDLAPIARKRDQQTAVLDGLPFKVGVNLGERPSL